MDFSAELQDRISRQLAQVHGRIADACADAGRSPETVTLVAVSKTQPAAAIAAAAAAGQRDFGENYLQEALAKQPVLAGQGLVWHFIGPIQSNKTREIAAHFDWVHGVDRLKIAQRLSEQRPAALAPLQICLQVNISGEDSKSGVAPADVSTLAAQVAGLPRLQLRGLMAIPAPVRAGGDLREPFRALRWLQQSLNNAGLALDTLSMGMSDDLEAAVAEGATQVRIGTAIFGARAPL